MKRNVTFNGADLKLAGHLYMPEAYRPDERRAAVVTSHPFGGVKEQTAGLCARTLAERGVITLAFDAPCHGECGGLPRHLEDPFTRAEGLKCAVSFLATLNHVTSDGRPCARRSAAWNRVRRPSRVPTICTP